MLNSLAGIHSSAVVQVRRRRGRPPGSHKQHSSRLVYHVKSVKECGDADVSNARLLEEELCEPLIAEYDEQLFRAIQQPDKRVNVPFCAINNCMQPHWSIHGVVPAKFCCVSIPLRCV